MPGDTPPKSAYELAMERLSRQDREEGREQPKPLSARQKAEIAELRQKAKAKLAELEILHRKALQSLQEPEKIKELEERYEIDRRRVDAALETDLARVRRGPS